MDIFNKCEQYSVSREVQAAGLYTYYRAISSPQDPVVQMDGEDVIMLGSNNYLGLTNHPEVKQASIEATQEVVKGGTRSRGDETPKIGDDGG